MNTNNVVVTLTNCGVIDDSYFDNHSNNLNQSNKTIATQPGAPSQKSGQKTPLTPQFFLETGGSSSSQSSSFSRHTILLDVMHFRQDYHWDCGVTCVQMVLRHFGSEYTSRELMDMVGTQSVWTIDILALLKTAYPNGTFLLCSKNLGVDDSYSDLDMYKKEFDNDSVRVANLFKRASSLELECQEVVLEHHDLGRLMLTGTVLLIILVDISKVKASSRLRFGRGYVGHYILVTGYDAVTSAFSYLDPAQTSEVRNISAAQLDMARCCEGTDEDIIIIQLPPDHEPVSKDEPVHPLDRFRQNAFEVSDQFFDRADMVWGSLFDTLSSKGQAETHEQNELKTL
mmetsp:Transcript_5072/g.6575  ORF Transcript_5072/g.6575 Transcript_5072/m.6575 type:complete len:342 (+) Transcript_5072:131-1156(+)|eukprot:CAMPEP_0114338908 /NCGR_PEP_ID=MMETSP0101-20121206/7362_1 /TAXON_ID=38822 ORGANISM="Pteridomonas danica, Strain PT" /NCGR_SAMPLE_ID=MMETSP0101 /ASSEMBLY_ACC=CAM_ASM_000211 /LENGTH=341 /DNA_ID=CAMNT_0001471671 /DNA_START=57 /DNA_END=1082 /DNA_ORIENTATION=+